MEEGIPGKLSPFALHCKSSSSLHMRHFNDFRYGNKYNTVLIGKQCWTKENLKVSRYNNGDLIPLDTSGGSTGNGSGETWTSRSTGAITVFRHNVSNLSILGYLYNWYTVKDPLGICPTGWHVPTYSELTTLWKFLGGDTEPWLVGPKMKSKFSWPFLGPHGTTNESGFSALPSGIREGINTHSLKGIFHSADYVTVFFSSSQYDSNSFWVLYLDDNALASQFAHYNIKNDGLSVRCIKN